MRQQLALYRTNAISRLAQSADRIFWPALRRLYSGGPDALILVKRMSGIVLVSFVLAIGFGNQPDRDWLRNSAK